jgi:YVTN family beta-propeller protein
MMRTSTLIVVLAATALVGVQNARAGQAPGPANAPDIAISHKDRFYTSDQFSNTVSVIDPMDNRLVGVLRLGDATPANLSPLYKGQLLVHGMGFSPDHRTLAVVSIGSNSVTFIETATNAIKHVTYVGRSPHEAFFTRDGKEVWVTVRGEDYIAVLDGQTFEERARIKAPAGPGMTIFSPDGQYGYVCSSFSPETVVIATAEHEIVGRVKQESPFCPDIAATPDGEQVWLTLKDVGKAMVFNARPPFEVVKVIDTGPITNHINFARNARGQFAYVTIGGMNEVKVFDTASFEQVAAIPTGALPHGIWPSGDGARMYVGLENADAAAVIDTLENKVIATIAIGQAPQGVAYISNAVPEGDGTQGLQPLGVAANSVRLTLAGRDARPATQVSLFDQGVVQILQAAVAGLPPNRAFILALSEDPKGTGHLETLAAFMTNPAGAAIVNAVGQIRQVVQGDANTPKRYLVIANGTAAQPGEPVQVQTAP